MNDAGRHQDQHIYHRMYSADPESVPVRLGSVCVAVIGVGGIGSELMRHLASAGVGTLLCIDADRVRAANLNRQHCFGPGDTGRLKIDCMREHLGRLFPETRVIGVAQHIDSAGALSDALACLPACDYIACCADEPVGGIELACLRVAEQRDCPVGFCAMQLRRGYWGMARGRAARHSAQRFFMLAAGLADTGGAGVLRGSASWTNTAIAAFFAEAVAMHLAGLDVAGDNRDGLTAFDFDTMRAASIIRFNRESP